MMRYFEVAFALICLAGVSRSEAEVERHDFFVDGDPGVQLFVREVVIRTGISDTTGEPILLLHGARVPGVASFDLSVPGGSFAADLAQLGFDVYVMDVRGYGQSTRPIEMDEPPGSHAPLVRSSQAAHDISAVVDSIRKRRSVARVALFGGQLADSGPATTPVSTRKKSAL
jgi:alpha-beta hydrolase superfamily lysophospholipase